MGNRWKNYGLWAAILALIPLILSSFGIHIIENYQQIVNALLGILVMAGIISNPTTQSKGFGDDPVNQEPPTDDTQK